MSTKKIVYRERLPELVVTGKMPFTSKISKFINDEILLNKGNVRTNTLRRRPSAMNNFQVGENALEFANIASAGLLNRLSPTQDLRLLYDIVTGENVMDSWFGNNGIVPDQFAQEHPYGALGINTVADFLAFGLGATGKTKYNRVTQANKLAKEKGLASRNMLDASDIEQIAKNNPYPHQVLGQAIGDTYKEGKQFVSNLKGQLSRSLDTAWRTPRKTLGNMSLRSFLKPFRKDFKKINVEQRFKQNEASVKQNIEKEFNGTEATIYPFGEINVNIPKRTISKDIEFVNPITGEINTAKKLSTESGNLHTKPIQLVNTETPIVFSDVKGDLNVTTNEGQYFPNNLSAPIKKYADEMTKIVGDDAILGGSTPIYANDFAAGVPGDLELVSTESRLPSLKQKLKAKSTQAHGDFGYDLDSEYGIGTNKYGNRNPITVQIIQESKNGKATGPLAHEYYSLLYPEEYEAMVDDAVKHWYEGPVAPYQKTPYRITLDDFEFPISAEELYKQITPEVQRRKLLRDLFLSDKDKHYNRAFQMLTHPDANIRAQARMAMREAIEHHAGSGYEMASETYPNLRFDNVEANKEFLKSLNLPEEYASNPEIMKNIVDRWHIAETTQSRNLFRFYGGTEYLPNLETVKRAAISTYAPNNGSASGIGGNTVRYFGGGGLGGDFGTILKQRLTLYPESMTTPMDLYNQRQKLSNFRDRNIVDFNDPNAKLHSGDVYKEIDAIESRMRSGDLTEAEGIKLKQKIAEEYDIPFYAGGEYRNAKPGVVSYYSGNNIPPEILRIYPIKGDHFGILPEIGGKGIPTNFTGTVRSIMRDEAFPSSKRPFSLYDPIYDIPSHHNKLAKTMQKQSKQLYALYDDAINWSTRINNLNSKIRNANSTFDTYKSLGKVIGVTSGVFGPIAGGVLYTINKNKKEYESKLNNLFNKIDNIEDVNTWSKEAKDEYYKLFGVKPEEYNTFTDEENDPYDTKTYYEKYKEFRHKQRKERKSNRKSLGGIY